jgi:competence protein ComEC
VPRSWIPVAALGAAVAGVLSRAPRVGARTRRWTAALGGAAAITAWPALLALQARGTLEVLAVDVGQGDAIALRTPAGRWVLIDAGPPRPGDAGGAPVVRELRRRGVRRLELLVLTHPDLDHVGGAEAVLSSFEVGAVLEPSRPTGKDAYVSLLEAAAARGVPWKRAQAGQRFTLDGVTLEVLSPPGPDAPRAKDDTESNAVSVVLVVRYGALDALLTGDAPKSVERRVAPAVGSTLEILKVGHHGSTTSTDTLLLARAHPRVALVSVGKGNRFGHPAPGVLATLERFGVEIHRTDREGTLRVLGRRDGSLSVVGAHVSR